jgi:hypothetical protein
MNHGSFLCSIGVDYFDYGSIKNGRQVRAYFYKLCKPIDADSFRKICEKYPNVSLGHSRAEYAPELTSCVLIFPSKAELKRGLK